MNDQRDTVLFVDDEEINLLIFERRFQNDFKVLTAASGMEALETLKKFSEKIKVLISDMRMPVMDGLELIKTAKRDYADIQYFVLTGYNFNEDLEQALEKKDIDRLFKKPFDYKLIKDAIAIH